MQLTAVIIEDERKLRENFIQLLRENCPEIIIVGDAGNITDGYQLIMEKKPQVLFLDIEMPGGNGFELLLKFNNPSFETIFVSSYGHYAIKAIRLSALDYLLKPVSIEELQGLPERIKEAINLKESALKYKMLEANLKNTELQKKLVIRSKAKLESYNLSDIVYLNSDDNYTSLHLNGQKRLVISKTLKEYEEMLCMEESSSFMRIHKTFIVNLHFVKKIERGNDCIAVLKDDTQLAVSRRKKTAFIEKFDSL